MYFRFLAVFVLLSMVWKGFTVDFIDMPCGKCTRSKCSNGRYPSNICLYDCPPDHWDLGFNHRCQSDCEDCDLYTLICKENYNRGVPYRLLRDIVCNSPFYCTNCIDGYYGTYCEYKCEIGCELGQCEPGDGSCVCRPNFIGAKCDKCMIGKYGPLCQYDCPRYCTGPCDKVDGSCCDWKGGYHCHQILLAPTTSPCRKTCKFNVCETDTELCLLGCISGFFGPKCEHVCPTNCSASQLFQRCADENSGCNSECVNIMSNGACSEDASKQDTAVSIHGTVVAYATLSAVMIAIFVFGIKYIRKRKHTMKTTRTLSVTSRSVGRMINDHEYYGPESHTYETVGSGGYAGNIQRYDYASERSVLATDSEYCLGRIPERMDQ